MGARFAETLRELVRVRRDKQAALVQQVWSEQTKFNAAAAAAQQQQNATNEATTGANSAP